MDLDTRLYSYMYMKMLLDTDFHASEASDILTHRERTVSDHGKHAIVEGCIG